MKRSANGWRLAGMFETGRGTASLDRRRLGVCPGIASIHRVDSYPVRLIANSRSRGVEGFIGGNIDDEGGPETGAGLYDGSPFFVYKRQDPGWRVESVYDIWTG